MHAESMSPLDELLDVDHKNSQESRRALLEVNSRSIEIAENGARVLHVASEALGQESKIGDIQSNLSDWAAKHGIPPDHALHLLDTATLIGGPEDDFTRAKDTMIRGTAFYARVYLLMRLRRDYLFGLTDLLRLRITASQGYLRLQSETMAILALALSEPEIGSLWLDTMREERGKNFYKRHHGKIVQKIKDLGLHFYYEQASQNALHSRVGGIASGVVQGNAIRRKGEASLVYQEANDPLTLFLWFCSYLRFHEMLARSLTVVVPEAAAALPKEVEQFRSGVEDLWKLLMSLRSSQTSTHSRGRAS